MAPSWSRQPSQASAGRPRKSGGEMVGANRKRKSARLEIGESSRSTASTLDNYGWSTEEEHNEKHNLKLLAQHAFLDHPLLNVKESVHVVAPDNRVGSPILTALQLSKIFSHMRQIRADGNSFYRGFMLSYLEHILVTQDTSEALRVRSKVEQCKQDLLHLGHPDYAIDDFFKAFTDTLNYVSNPETSISYTQLLEKCCDQENSNYIVMFLRLVTYAEMRTKSKLYPSTDELTTENVLILGKEINITHIDALCNALCNGLGVHLKVVQFEGPHLSSRVYSPRREGPAESDSSDSVFETSSNQPKHRVILLYRSETGGYDVLYSSEAGDD